MRSCFDSIHVKQYEIATCITDLQGSTEISPKVRSGAANYFNLEKNLNAFVVEYNRFSDTQGKLYTVYFNLLELYPLPNYIE